MASVPLAAFLRPQWFRWSPCKFFGMNGGDDETRTRDLCRDSMLWISDTSFKPHSATSPRQTPSLKKGAGFSGPWYFIRSRRAKNTS